MGLRGLAVNPNKDRDIADQFRTYMCVCACVGEMSKRRFFNVF